MSAGHGPAPASVRPPSGVSRRLSLMFSTTFAAVVLSAALAEAPSVPAWESNYARASETAVAQRKPLAVFIGHGEGGYSRLVGGDMPTEAGRLLAANYVALYVNTDTA